MSPAGRTRLIGVDGRSGAGKTTLADRLAAALAEGGAPLPVGVFHLEELYPGWDGLDAGMEQYRRSVLESLTAGRPARWTDWDWVHDRPGRTHVIDPGGLLIAEGVGVGHAAARPLLDALVWVEVPAAERRERALARDGDLYRPHWARWAAQEDSWLETDDVAAAADVVVTGDPGVHEIARRLMARLHAVDPGPR
ncbi:hypothetical protein [Tersicoccus sp. Bi-70]|uniref:hypothetical protein n=1 Tax=Tersicoccus sp. Bi-70 TaxID=1897634 RepID=UPI0009780648|nr:hypothetical protein [Tersicoccus sp. Bi-70]OMH34363.1 hypothetical protein BGP79_04475 [Tersicoccus sp. Bi-70]